MKERLRFHYMPLLFLVLIAGFIFYTQRANRDMITFVAQATGYISLVMLGASLIIGPGNILLKRKNPVSTYFRRDISIVAGTLAVIHTLTGLFVHMRGRPWLYFLVKSDQGYKIRLDNFGLANYTGLLSALIIIMLLITSNDYMLKKLNPVKWKNIQRFAYPMLILTFIHCYFFRIGKENLNIIYWFYLPLITLIVIFQTIGICLRMRNIDR